MRSNPFLLPTNAVPRRESLPKEKPKKVIKLSSKRRNSSPEDSCYHPIDLPDPESLKPLKCTPLEVAAQWAHLDCVKTLLDLYILRAYPELGMKGYLTLASLANDVPSLKLLLSVSPCQFASVSVCPPPPPAVIYARLSNCVYFSIYSNARILCTYVYVTRMFICYLCASISPFTMKKKSKKKKMKQLEVDDGKAGS